MSPPTQIDWSRYETQAGGAAPQIDFSKYETAAAPTGKFIPGTGPKPPVAPVDAQKASMHAAHPFGTGEVPERFLKSAVHAVGLPATPEEFQARAQEEQNKTLGQRMMDLPLGGPFLTPNTIVAAGKTFGKAGHEVAESARAGAAGRPIDAAGHGIGALGYTAAGALTPIGGQNLVTAGEQLGSGDVSGGLGTTAGVLAPFALAHGAGAIEAPKPPVAAVPKTAPVEALATMIDDRGGAVDPHAIASDIHPVLSNQAALDKLDLTKLEGRAVGQAAIKTVDNAVKAHQAEVAQISKPYEKVLVDQSPIAQAYLDQRTPELRRNDPAAAARLLREARHYAGVDNNGVITGAIPAPLSDVNAFRIRLNNETAAAQGKAEGAYRKTDWETKADVKALIAARDVQYGTLARVSGLPEETIRTLQSREGQLMETRDGLTKEFNKVSASQAEAAAGSLKANPPGSGRFLTAAREKIGHTYPSRHGAERTLLRETIAPHPIETFNNRLKLAFSEPGPGTAPPTYQQVPGAAGTAKPQITPPQPPTAPVSNKVGGAKVLAGDVPLTGPVSPVAADITRLKGELKAATDPKEIADIQQALQHAQARLEGRPFQPPSQAEVERLPAQQPRTVEPGPSSRGQGGALPTLRRIEQPRNPTVSTAPDMMVHSVTTSGDTLHVNFDAEHAIGKLGADSHEIARKLLPEFADKIGPYAVSIGRREAFGPQAGKYHLQIRMAPGDLQAAKQTLERGAMAPSSRSAGLPGPERAAAVAAAMQALKNGEITQAEADKRIQRANGGGGRKLIRFPQAPND